MLRALIACGFEEVALAVKVPANRYRPHTAQRYDTKSETMPNTSLKDGSVLVWGGGGLGGDERMLRPFRAATSKGQRKLIF
jgi:hypothetical protein